MDLLPALRRTAAIVALIVGVAACGSQDPTDAGDAVGAVDTARGQELFAANCAVCHGALADGATTGPPLVHEIYEPSHHPDEAFQRAVADGVAAHHWDFGPMPPIGGLDRDDVADITAWVRELQREAGIE